MNICMCGRRIFKFEISDLCEVFINFSKSFFFFSLGLSACHDFSIFLLKFYAIEIFFSRLVGFWPELTKNYSRIWIEVSFFYFLLKYFVRETLIRHYSFLKHSRSSHRMYFAKKGVLKNFTKFIAKHLCQSFFFDKVAWKRDSGRKRDSGTGVFLWILWNF